MNRHSIIDFSGLDYLQYCLDNRINELPLIEIDINSFDDLSKKRVEKWATIDPKNKIPLPPELDDLIRLHYIVRTRKVRTILEFGGGKSTSVFADAIRQNKLDYSDLVGSELRIANPFEVHSIENNEEWKNVVEDKLRNYENVFFQLCSLHMGEFNSRICTYYNGIPNIRPDLIYLDGPDQFSVIGDVRGIHTRHLDRMPMAADILTFEHFLEPGTLIVVDGRTANARFLKANFQRDWKYQFCPEFDQHFFELNEEPLGRWNAAAIQFTSK
jgi:hypothetical protein